MEYVSFRVNLDRPVANGTSRRAHLEASARKGNAEAVAELNGPECPEVFLYLHAWAVELVGRSGMGMDGPAPLSYTTIQDWARLTGRTVTPEEVRALIRIDAALRQSNKEEAIVPPVGEETPTAVIAPWPTRASTVAA